jgi:chromosome partitioning protein
MSDIRYFAIAAGRGGTGKSTLAFALADALTQRGFTDVALLDLDSQAGVTGYAGQPSAEDPVRARPVSITVERPRRRGAPLPMSITLYRGGRALAHASAAEMAAHIARAGDEGSSDRIVVADLPPALTDKAHTAMFARDDVYVIGAVRAEPGTFKSLNELVALVTRAELPYLLVPTFVKKHATQLSFVETIRSQHEGHVSAHTVPIDQKAIDCVMYRKPVTAWRCRATQGVQDLLEEIVGPAGVPAEV